MSTTLFKPQGRIRKGNLGEFRCQKGSSGDLWSCAYTKSREVTRGMPRFEAKGVPGASPWGKTVDGDGLKTTRRDCGDDAKSTMRQIQLNKPE